MEKQLDKTWNLPGGTRQFRIYDYEDHVWFEERWMVASLCDE
jgi:hypothetical protein